MEPNPQLGAPPPPAQPPANPPPPPPSPWLEFLRVRRGLRLPAVGVGSFLMMAAVVALGYFCWYVWLAPLWHWGFDPVTWRGILAAIGAFYLLIIPFIPLGAAPYLGQILGLYLSDQEHEVRARVGDLTEQQRMIEDQLAASDPIGLIRLMRHSRLELEAYYTIGISQTQKSFRYSVVAMWIGFCVIVMGVVPRFIPLGQRPPSEETVHFLAVGAGLVIEVTSALFLWIYRSSIAQLTYFYNRQIFTYNVIMASRIADSMDDPSDAKTIIVRHLLDRLGEGPKPHALPAGPRWKLRHAVGKKKKPHGP